MPATKIARQARVQALLNSRAVRSQAELATLLADDGLVVGQATLSRDRGERGVHSASSQEQLDTRLIRLCGELLVTAEASANIAVLRTPPGAANFLALAIDHSVMPSILGTIAGDDTVMVISREPLGGSEVAARFLQFAAESGAGA